MKIVGAGLGRTGTTSLKVALEYLLDGPCYHMIDVNRHPSHVDFWHAAAADHGKADWQGFFADYAAAVDWPAAAFWPELSAIFPDALILLSVRSPESWWRSANTTIFPSILGADGAWRAMMDTLFKERFPCDLTNEAAATQAFREHVADVQRRVPTERLLVWQASDGWEPLCRALSLPVPDKPFPHANTTEDFLK